MHSIISAILNSIPKHAEKFPLHTRWNHFINDNWIDPGKSKQQQWESVMKKVPSLIQESHQAAFDFFKHLYSLLHPEIVMSKQIEKELYFKEAIAQEIVQEKRRELTQMIALGVPVSEQRMKEAFGEKAQKQQKIFTEKFGASFFNAEDEQERDAAIREAGLMQPLIS
jgi:hypothetical protein